LNPSIVLGKKHRQGLNHQGNNTKEVFVADFRIGRIVTGCHNHGRVIVNLPVFGSQMPDMNNIIRVLKNTTKDRYEKILLDLEKK
jgi:hypothetical protein